MKRSGTEEAAYAPAIIAKCERERERENVENMTPKGGGEIYVLSLVEGLELVCAARPVAKRIAAAICDTKYVLFM